MNGNIEIHKELRDKYENINAKYDGNSIELRVLIIENHPLMQKEIAKAFIEVNKSQEDYFFVLDLAFNCEEAYVKLKGKTSTINQYDLIVLDIKLPPYFKEKIYSGEDIGQWVKKNISPSPKIIIITFINDKQRIENLIKNINPNGLLIKEDISCKILFEAFLNSFEQDSYYTHSVASIATKLLSSNLTIDILDRRILIELSCGSTMKEMEEILPLSLSAIQKRKKKLMDAFNINNSSVRELVLTAKEQGFI